MGVMPTDLDTMVLALVARIDQESPSRRLALLAAAATRLSDIVSERVVAGVSFNEIEDRRAA